MPIGSNRGKNRIKLKRETIYFSYYVQLKNFQSHIYIYIYIYIYIEREREREMVTYQ